MAGVNSPKKLLEFFSRIASYAFKSDGTEVAVLAENDGTPRSQLILADPTDDTQVRAAADKSGGDKGALHVKLKSLATQINSENANETVAWLKVIAWHLAEMRHEHITPSDLDHKDGEDMN